MEITATLKQAFWVDDHRSPNISGVIYGDTARRFNDGERIYTSTVLEKLDEGIYKTRNSIYKVEFQDKTAREFP